MKKPFTTLELVMMAMFTAILCGSAYLSIPTPLPGGAKITMLNFMIILIALVFRMRDAVIIIALWMLLGAIGIPVYIGGRVGIGYLFGPFGGYAVSFIVVAVVTGLIKGKKYNRIWYTVVAVIGVVITDLIGMVWWKAIGTGDSALASWKAAFLAGFIAFIPLDLVKAVVAAQLVPLFKRIIPAGDEAENEVTQAKTI